MGNMQKCCTDDNWFDSFDHQLPTRRPMPHLGFNQRVTEDSEEYKEEIDDS